MRLSSRAIVTSIAACSLAVGWIGATGASAGSAAEPPGARHIVVLRDDADSDAVARDHGRRYGAKVEHVYHNALKGYVATFKGTGASDVARDPRVDFVELDREVSIHAAESPQASAPWGLDRIDQSSGLDTFFHYNATGADVTAYIIDTGIDYAHQDFGNRAVPGHDAIKATDDGKDCEGHGTHVAGTVGGARFGVAKDVRLVSVRVLDCKGSGSYSGVIAGVDWVTGDHDAGEPAVANMSLGGPTSSALDAAIRNSIEDGVTYVVAAGNGNRVGIGQDACKYSPARVSDALTIGATDRTDRKASFSNYGKCVDWFAPGVDILSAKMGSGSGGVEFSGTSMAAPHTAGVVALFLEGRPASSPAQVRSALFDALSENVVTSAGKGTLPHLLHSNV